MNKNGRLLAGLVMALVLIGAAARLAHRWREEAADSKVALAADWTEFSELAARTAHAPIDLMRVLRAQGVTSLVISPITLNDLFLEHRLQPAGLIRSVDPWDVSAMRLGEKSNMVDQVVRELSFRGVQDLKVRHDEGGAVLWLERGTFAAIKDIDIGFDPLVLKDLQRAGLVPIFRIYADPWMSAENAQADLEWFPLLSSAHGVLFSSEDLPGGLAAIDAWRSWLLQTGGIQFIPEFRPAAAAWQMAHALPANTYRAHTIPVLELKDLKPPQQFARWRRAVEERSCRLLLVHVALNDSLGSYLRNLAVLSGVLEKAGFTLGFPKPRTDWIVPSDLQKWLNAIVAFGIAVLGPLVALRRGMKILPRWLSAFISISALSVLTGLLVAAIAQNPDTRLEIMPMRGIKAAFLLSWVGALFMLYGGRELGHLLSRSAKRWEILAGGVLVAAVAYMLLRTGNAPSAWQPSWEQNVRETLENMFVARPRFKEFLVGHPALLVGLYLQSIFSQRRVSWDSRPLIWLGTLGPISIVNTFCHLHSPLKLELLRTANGLVLGLFFGLMAIAIVQRVSLHTKIAAVKKGSGRTRSTQRKTPRVENV